MAKQFCYFFIAVMFFASCAKEQSFESGFGLFTNAEGTLKDSTNGLCGGIKVVGTYNVDSVLRDTNYLIVTATITKGGKYNIYSDTVNGIWFRDSAFVLNKGVQTFKLKGFGKIILPVNPLLTIYFNNSSCMVSIPLNGSSPNPNPTPINKMGTDNDYYPTKTGNYWLFDKINSLNVASLSETKVIGSSIIGAFAYQVFSNNGGGGSTIRKDGNGKYYDYTDLGGRLMAKDEILILDDRLSVGQTFTSKNYTVLYQLTPQTTVNLTFRIVNTIQEKKAVLNLNNTNYNNTIKVYSDFQIIFPFSTDFTSSGLGVTTIYAYNIGVIYTDLKDVPEPSTSGVYTLKSYQLN
jgi:hypothetical protein